MCGKTTPWEPQTTSERRKFVLESRSAGYMVEAQSGQMYACCEWSIHLLSLSIKKVNAREE